MTPLKPPPKPATKTPAPAVEKPDYYFGFDRPPVEEGYERPESSLGQDWNESPELRGVLSEISTFPTKFGQCSFAHIIDDDGNETRIVLTATLKNQIKNHHVGRKIIITFLGEKDSGKGSPTKLFDVQMGPSVPF